MLYDSTITYDTPNIRLSPKINFGRLGNLHFQSFLKISFCNSRLRRYAKNDVIIFDYIGKFFVSYCVKHISLVFTNICPTVSILFDFHKLIISTSIFVFEEDPSYKTKHYTTYKQPCTSAGFRISLCHNKPPSNIILNFDGGRITAWSSVQYNIAFIHRLPHSITNLRHSAL